jgi:hypothetical protein
METIKQIFLFLASKKKLWLLPFILVVVGVGSLLFLAQGSLFAPFIYALF